MADKTFDEVMHTIARVNEEGIDWFRSTIDDVEVAFQLFARVEDARLIVRCALATGTAGFGELDLQGACLCGLAPATVTQGPSSAAVQGEILVDRMLELPVAAEVLCDIDGAWGEARMTGAFSFF